MLESGLRVEEAPIDALGADLFEPLDRLARKRSLDAVAGDRSPGRIEAVDLAGFLQGLEGVDDVLEPYVRFDPGQYTRLRLRRALGYEALLLCWMPGQCSPIHDHFGSECAFRVVQGVGVETMFRLAGSSIVDEDTRRLRTHTVSASQNEDIHKLGCSGREGLVTLHLYSPALPKIRTYRRVLLPEEDAA